MFKKKSIEELKREHEILEGKRKALEERRDLENKIAEEKKKISEHSIGNKILKTVDTLSNQTGSPPKKSKPVQKKKKKKREENSLFESSVIFGF